MTVTTCAVSQFADVNVMRLVTVASPVSDEEIESTTLDDGWALRTTVKVSVSPASVTAVEPSGSETVNPEHHHQSSKRTQSDQLKDQMSHRMRLLLLK